MQTQAHITVKSVIHLLFHLSMYWYISTCCVMAKPMTGSPSKMSHVTTAELPSKVLMVTLSGADKLSEDKSHKRREKKRCWEGFLSHQQFWPSARAEYLRTSPSYVCEEIGSKDHTLLFTQMPSPPPLISNTEQDPVFQVPFLIKSLLPNPPSHCPLSEEPTP